MRNVSSKLHRNTTSHNHSAYGVMIALGFLVVLISSSGKLPLVTGKDNSGESFLDTSDNEFTIQSTVAPTSVTVTPISETQITLQWTDLSTNEVGYSIIQQSGGVTTIYPSLGNRFPADTTNFNITSLRAATKYTFRICAHAPLGPSQCSAAIEVKTPFTTFFFTTSNVSPSGDVTKWVGGQAQQYQEDLGNGTKLEMVSIQSGNYTMGAPATESGTTNFERPEHRVTIKGFAMGKFEVTQAQWMAIMGNNPSTHIGDNLPVENVSWDDAQDFCRRLNAKLGLGVSNGYRLPTEAEWEYAARAGTRTPFAFGASINVDIVNYNGSYPYDSGKVGIDRAQTVNVGSLGVANGWGLYDMYGNVLEWCEDDWNWNYSGAPSNGSAWVKSPRAKFRPLRGGNYGLGADRCRSASRLASTPDSRKPFVGFRLSRTLP